MPPIILDARGCQLFSPTFYAFTLTFLHLPTLEKSLSYWMPPAWMPGAVAPPYPHLHATVDKCLVRPVCAVACRRSWMPRANEVLGCPQVKKISINSSE